MMTPRDAKLAANRAWDKALEEAAALCEQEAALTYGMYKEIRLDLAKKIRAKRIDAAHGEAKQEK